MSSVYKRELSSYFHSMIGYVFIAFLVCFIGVYYMAVNLMGGYPYFSYALSNAQFVFLVAVPILTMRSISEDKKLKTDQLLLTSPLSIQQIVLGKYFAMLTILAIPTAVFCIFPLIIEVLGEGHLMADYNTIFAFFLLGAVYIAIGELISSVTENQIIAVVVTFGVLLLSYLWSALEPYLPTTSIGSLVCLVLVLVLLCALIYAFSKNALLSGCIGVVGLIGLIIAYFVTKDSFAGLFPTIWTKLSLNQTFNNIASYFVFDLRGIVLYLSLIVLFLFLTVQNIAKSRWN